MATFKITCVFDITCPWCYIAHESLHPCITKRKNEAPSDKFQITLVPFYLKPPPQVRDPSIPPFPVPTQSRQTLREETYGKAQAQTVVKKIDEAAKKVGLSLKFDGVTGSTRNGHRLIQHARLNKDPEAAEKVLATLFKKYHEEEIDITRLDILTDVGVESDLGHHESVRDFLQSGEGGSVVDDMVARAAKDHFGGVPWFMVEPETSNKALKISGAQTEDTWHRIFDKIQNGLYGNNIHEN